MLARLSARVPAALAFAAALAAPGPAAAARRAPTKPFAVTAVPRTLVAERLVLAEWARAENRAACAPLAFASVGQGGWSARRATFSGGWAVAFDLPGQRSAFGVAGSGSLPEDRAPDAGQREALRAQWPAFVELPALSGFAGYGPEGGGSFAAGSARGEESTLAYVRAGGQPCLYNVWSRLGRAHLELLLDQLRLVSPPGH